MKSRIIRSISESIVTKELLKAQAQNIARATQMIIECLRDGGKIILFGNGGSAADAQHIAAEFMGRYLIQRRPLPALALNVNTSALTAIANDDGFEHVFERQIYALCTHNDISVGLSTSGNSANVLLGIEATKRGEAKTIGLTGESGGKLARLVDLAIRVPSNSTPRIQESHILIGHIISELVEEFFARESSEGHKKTIHQVAT